jgi:hypothetical protein
VRAVSQARAIARKLSQIVTTPPAGLVRVAYGLSRDQGFSFLTDEGMS